MLAPAVIMLIAISRIESSTIRCYFIPTTTILPTFSVIPSASV